MHPAHAPSAPLKSVRARGWLSRAFLPFTVLVSALGLAACGSHGVRGVHAGVPPEGATFQGVWLSPQYGEMTLCVTGRHAMGTYEKNERSGRIRGEIEGDILWFNWEESRTYVPGSPVEVSGRGYFRLSLNEDNDSVLTGEWGMDNDRTGGGPWTALRRRRQPPDTCSGSRGGATRELSWDEDEGEQDPAESEDDGF
jgi:hypothetical protein